MGLCAKTRATTELRSLIFLTTLYWMSRRPCRAVKNIVHETRHVGAVVLFAAMEVLHAIVVNGMQLRDAGLLSTQKQIAKL